MKVLFVAGDYDDNGGKSSGYMSKLSLELKELYFKRNRCIITRFNGGSWSTLQNYIVPETMDSNIIYWFSHSPSDKTRFVERIKKLAPCAILIMLSRNDNKSASIFEQTSKMLSVKANLMLELHKTETGMFSASILDPLGNCFLENEPSTKEVARILLLRTGQLSVIERVPSISIGTHMPIVEENEFFSIAKESANKFHDLLHADKQDRYLGNISFRCESGFPSFRKDNLIYVSKRNLDKRTIGANGFVAIHPRSFNVVQYYGDEKPSVDTPIQLLLYNYYNKIKYMIHSHVYIEGAPETGKILPCGAVEEYDEIVRFVQDMNVDNIAINLLGHGSLVGSADLSFFKTIKYIARPMPTMMLDYLNATSISF